MRTDTNRYHALFLVLLLMAFLPTSVIAQSDDAIAEKISQALIDIGIQNAEVIYMPPSVLILYEQDIANMLEWETELRKFAEISRVATTVSPNTLNHTSLAVKYSDGNELFIHFSTQDAADFLSGNIDTEMFASTLYTSPYTRGPTVSEGLCNTEQGDNCANQPSACSCYLNELCSPEEPDANARGCLEQFPPSNAELVDGVYYCVDDKVWNGTLTGCVAEHLCEDGQFKFNGVCYDEYIAHESNTTPDSSSTEADTPADINVDEYYEPDWDPTYIRSIRRIIILGTVGIGVVLLIAVTGVILVVRHRRKRNPRPQTAAVSQSTPITPVQETAYPVPPPPVIVPVDPRFQQLEQRFADLTRAYRTGQLTAHAYQTAAQQLVIQDARGHWSFSSGEWLWFDGKQWLRRNPRN